jgi:hypothetical protein
LIFDIESTTIEIVGGLADNCLYFVASFSNASRERCSRVLAPRITEWTNSSSRGIAVVSSFNPEEVDTDCGLRDHRTHKCLYPKPGTATARPKKPFGYLRVRCPECAFSVARYAAGHGYTAVFRMATTPPDVTDGKQAQTRNNHGRYFIKMDAMRDVLFDTTRFNFRAALWVRHNTFTNTRFHKH